MTEPRTATRAAVALGPILCIVATASAITWAADGNVGAFLDRVRAALEPGGASVRTMEVRVSGPDGAADPITVRQARTAKNGARHVLTVVVAPVEAAGTAVLLSQRRDAPEERWIYAPVVRRTRLVVPVLRHEPFLNTDFSLADLGFMDTPDTGSFSLVSAPAGEESAHLVGIQEMPEDQTVYSRIVTWVDADRGVPQKREFYDRAGRLWKVQRFEDVRTVDGVATPMRLVMEDVQVGGSTEIRVTDVRRDVALSEDLFDPRRLSAAAGADVWTAPESTEGTGGAVKAREGAERREDRDAAERAPAG